VAYFSETGDEVVVRQYFLSDVSAERALLHAINDLFREFTAVVTFNGKTFDWPLLETRFIYNRLRSVLRDPPHLDMLGPSRRLWRDRRPARGAPWLKRRRRHVGDGLVNSDLVVHGRLRIAAAGDWCVSRVPVRPDRCKR
jgi:hypothetical protein